MSKFILSCEHAGNQLNGLIKIPKSVLTSHRAIDIGAFKIAEKLAIEFKTPFFYNKLSRLVIEYNRSLHHPKLWSEYSKDLASKTKEKLIEQHQQYRKDVIKQMNKTKTFTHLSIHSFTPVLNGEIRNCEIGILYDPARKNEKKLAGKLKEFLVQNGIKCRLNYPYLGKADGLTTHLRQKLGSKYLGMEIEFNQKIVQQSKFYNAFAEALHSVF